MNKIFRKKTLAVSIAAAIAGGFVFNVVPVFSQTAQANQLELAAVGIQALSKDIYVVIGNTTAIPVNALEFSNLMTSWGPGVFYIKPPAGVTLSSPSITPSSGGAITSAEIEDGGVKVVINPVVLGNPAYGMVSFSAVADDTAAEGPIVVTISDPNKILGSVLSAPLEVAYATSSSGIAKPIDPVTSVDSDALNQPAGFTLDYVQPTAANVSKIKIVPSVGKIIASNKGTFSATDNTMTFTEDHEANSTTLFDLLLDTTGAAPESEITLTLSSTDPESADPFTKNFKTQTIPLAKVNAALVTSVEVARQDQGDPGYETVFAGRNEQAVADTITVTESQPGALQLDKTLIYTFSSGVLKSGQTPTIAVSGGDDSLAATCNETPTPPVGVANCYISAVSTETAGVLTYAARVDSTQDNDDTSFDLRRVAMEGDLNVTVNGSAATTWQDNIVKFADIKKATSTVLNGTVPTGYATNNPISIPDIVLTESVAGALVLSLPAPTSGGLSGNNLEIQEGAGFITFALDDYLTLFVLPNVIVTDKNNAVVPNAASVFAGGAIEPAIAVTNPQARGFTIGLNGSVLPKDNGPYKLTISGLEVMPVTGVPAKTYQLTVGGDLKQAAVVTHEQSNTLAKPWSESFDILKLQPFSTTGSATGTKSGTPDNFTFSYSLTPATADLNRSGEVYLAMIMPPLPGITTDTTLGVFDSTFTLYFTGPFFDKTVPQLCRQINNGKLNAFKTGLLEPIIDEVLVTNFDASVFAGSDIYVGYGVGSPFITNSACEDMLTRDHLWYIGTIN